MEKLSWKDHVRNEEVLLRVKEQRNILPTIKEGSLTLTSHILSRHCHLQDVIERTIDGRIEMTGRR
jgi:hypothetical protein